MRRGALGRRRRWPASCEPGFHMSTPLRSRTAAPAAMPEGAARVRALARLLDAAVRIPGTNVRFGLDAVLGRVPGLGDLAGAGLSGYIILAAARMGAPAPVLLRMVLNVATETVVGAIPLLGDLFDVAWRANLRNTALLERHLGAPAATRAASRRANGWTIAGVVLALLLLAVGAAVLTVWLFRSLLELWKS